MICTKCGADKTPEEFATFLVKGERRLRGHCKVCEKDYKHAWREKNIEKCLAHSREWREQDPEAYKAYLKQNYKEHKDERIAKEKVRLSTPEGKARRNANSRKYRRTAEGKLKENTRAKVNAAIKYGKLVKPTNCTICGKECNTEAHHVDYNKPFEITWLCKQCHENIHHLNEGQES